MVDTKVISDKEYKKLWDDCQNKRRYESPPWAGIQYQLKRMTVSGQSGEGTEFANELERMRHEYHNPPEPMFIQMHTVDGLVYIYPERDRKKATL